LNQYILYQNFCTISISKHTNVASANDIGLDIMKLEITCNCIMDAFKNFNHFAFFVFKFNFPCGSHFKITLKTKIPIRICNMKCAP
jgi:hypothetical protein